MSLFSSIQLAKNSLFASQVGLQVTGNNIANANTPGYTRQEAIVSPASSQRIGNLILGLGVNVTAVVQAADQFLEERLRGANSDLKFGEAQEKAYIELESLIGELSDTDLSSSLSRFFNGFSDVLNQPESLSARSVATLHGQTLTQDIRHLDERVRVIRGQLDERIAGQAVEVNQAINEIVKLNKEIVADEGGGSSASDSAGLRDKRAAALTRLASLIDIRVVEQSTGAVNVFSGGEYLVFEGEARSVVAVDVVDGGQTITQLRLADTDLPISTSSGELAGLQLARDEVLGGFLERLDSFTKTLAFEFNKLHTSGQGLTGYSELTSEFAVADEDAALDQASLEFNPVSGTFQVQVYNSETRLTETTDVFVQLDGLEDDTTLTGLTAALDEIDGLNAEITAERKLSLTSDASNLQFAFANDDSGLLAALGLGTFFSGSSSSDVEVNQELLADASKLAASSGGIGADTINAERMAALLNAPLSSQNGLTLAESYDGLVGETVENAAVTRAVAEGYRVFYNTLHAQRLATSGVNLDEEAVNMIVYQRAFQASARFISTLSEVIEILVSL